jgi:hypothetical protein
MHPVRIGDSGTLISQVAGDWSTITHWTIVSFWAGVEQRASCAPPAPAGAVTLHFLTDATLRSPEGPEVSGTTYARTLT